jgi:hypothetical protein
MYYTPPSGVFSAAPACCPNYLVAPFPRKRHRRLFLMSARAFSRSVRRSTHPTLPDAPESLVLHAVPAEQIRYSRRSPPDSSDSPDAATFAPSQSTRPPSRPTAPSARRVYLTLRGAVLHRCRGDQDCHVARLLCLERGFPNPTPVLSFAWKQTLVLHC